MKPHTSPIDFERMYAECGPKLYRFCLRLTGRQSEAEDLVQDVFVAALVGQERFRGDSGIITWLFRIAIFKSRERRRKSQREASLTEDLLHFDPPSESKMSLDREIDALPEPHRVAFLLVKLEQFSSAEAARILGLPEGTVRFHVYLAIQRLRQRLAEPIKISPNKETQNAV